MIFSHIFELYLILCFSVVIHEVAHVVAAKIIKLDVKEIHIGDELFAIRFRNIFVSLNMLSGSYVLFSSSSMESKTSKEIVFFFLSGAFANLILIAIGSIASSDENLYARFLVLINVLLIMENCTPFVIKRNDVGKMIKYLRK